MKSEIYLLDKKIGKLTKNQENNKNSGNVMTEMMSL